MDKFDLLCNLQAISNFAYDIHYTAKGRNFYSDHLFSERLADVDVMDDFIETFYLGESEDAPDSSKISSHVAEITPKPVNDTQMNFKTLREMIVKVLIAIQNYKGTKGEEDLLGSVAHILQRHNGLLFRELVYTPEEIRNSDEEWENLVTAKETMGGELNNEKWITVHPNKENPDDYRRLKVEDGETSEEAVERKYGKDKKEPEKEEKKETEKKEPEKEDKKSDRKKDFIDLLKEQTNLDLNKYIVKDDGSQDYMLESFLSHPKRYKDSFLLKDRELSTSEKHELVHKLHSIKKFEDFDIEDFGGGYKLLRLKNDDSAMLENGGDGSGNFNHAGRTGKVGGSAKSEEPKEKEIATYQKTGRIIYGFEEIHLPEKEYATVENVFNSYKLPDGERMLVKEVHTKYGYARYYGIKDDNNNWIYFDREDLNYDL